MRRQDEREEQQLLTQQGRLRQRGSRVGREDDDGLFRQGGCVPRPSALLVTRHRCADIGSQPLQRADLVLGRGHADGVNCGHLIGRPAVVEPRLHAPPPAPRLPHGVRRARDPHLARAPSRPLLAIRPAVGPPPRRSGRAEARPARAQLRVGARLRAHGRPTARGRTARGRVRDRPSTACRRPRWRGAAARDDRRDPFSRPPARGEKDAARA